MGCPTACPPQLPCLPAVGQVGPAVAAGFRDTRGCWGDFFSGAGRQTERYEERAREARGIKKKKICQLKKPN